MSTLQFIITGTRAGYDACNCQMSPNDYSRRAMNTDVFELNDR